MTRKRFIWVDEDERIWAPERWLLEGLGVDVVAISDATSALRLMRDIRPDEVNLIILDVMLLPGDDVRVFSDIETDGGAKTGLVLGKLLAQQHASIGNKLLFFSRVTDSIGVAEITRISKDIGAHYLQKSLKTQGRNFINWLREKEFVE